LARVARISKELTNEVSPIPPADQSSEKTYLHLKKIQTVALQVPARNPMVPDHTAWDMT
jgi:hypothetical protein